MTVYFTSDTHFGHKNIIQYTNRPWPDVPAMNEGLIANWNSVVKPEDTVYHLGDFAMGPKTEHKGFLDRLQGRKILIRGNHDQKPAKMLDMGFNEVHTSLLLRLGPDGTVVPEGGGSCTSPTSPSGTTPTPRRAGPTTRTTRRSRPSTTSGSVATSTLPGSARGRPSTPVWMSGGTSP